MVASLEPERVDRRERGDEQLGLGRDARLADDVDVALHELAVAALLRALGAPDRRDLDAAEHRGQLGAVGRVEAGERHGQVEAQPEVDEVERLVGRLQVVAASSPRFSTPNASFSLSPPRPACRRSLSSMTGVSISSNPCAR